MYRTYILRLKPNRTQTKLLDKTISCVQKFDDIYFAQIKDTKIKSHREMLNIARNTDEDLKSIDDNILFCEIDILKDVKNKKNFFSKFQFKTNLCKYASSIDEVIFNDSINIPSIGTIKLFNKRDYDQVEQYATRKIKMHDGKILEDKRIVKINTNIEAKSMDYKDMNKWNEIK